ncbi:MAG: hypothetical protein KME32_05265 [Mojavia pulchra JT2-VF2]|jgi:hypothetical protein|uniref:Uncharacterized protein n=1 Tax=Mojavia pulchra JT2-VF2 TaxID=287848 RepID=A0A951PW57_9NOST|nr:hypothetical protein [Mojavia pulchra JT2-VF2]
MIATLDIKKASVRRNLWFERLIAILVLINFSLVSFDLTYIPLRDFYLQVLPGLTQLYDPIKGIQPHPETQSYLTKVDALQNQVLQTGLQSPEAESLLSELRLLSKRMIEDNSFNVPEKSGAWEKIKHEMRLHTNEPFARDALEAFWSSAYLSQSSWSLEIGFFDTQIRSLIESNFYRDIGKFGSFVNRFWLIDLPFIFIFALEFIARSFYISRRNPNLSWLEAILRRWYDLFLLLPFWRWLRIMPLTIRLYQANLLNVEPVRAQFNHDLAMSFAEELTEMVGVQMINQMQDAIRRGDIANWLFHPETRRPYVQLNNTNEVKAIANRLVTISLYDVLPKIQPDIEALVHHSIQSTLNESPIYQQIQSFPGLSHLPSQIAENLTKYFYQTAYNNFVKSFEDPVVAKLTDNLITNFRDSLEEELQKKHNLQEIQTWLVDMLEEIKINYVKNISEGGMEKLVEETENLRYVIR